ncbi:MAG: lysine 2,3-aminomutase [Bacteroidales bacterium]|nr:lysine 2,3-aminomutase [Bacteroidales bacterium]
MGYKAYSLRNFKEIPQIAKLSKEKIKDIEIVGRVLPFKTNSYVINELIDWDNYQNDPLFILTFPQRGMLSKEHYNIVEELYLRGANEKEILKTVNVIRQELNPHPAGQLEKNVPVYNGQRLNGVQHKYNETVLFFPSQGQTCHAYCTFCFRWPQFSGDHNLKQSTKEVSLLINYIKDNPEVTDLLFTGGDPMVMSANILSSYIDAVLEAKIPHLKTIRIGTKTLGFWPYRYLTDKDSDQIIDIFKRIVNSGLNLSIMAHFNHYRELESDAVLKAVKRIQSTGAIIRTQSPILNHINADSSVWRKMWKKQAGLGMIPYYMFIPRDTGAQKYFAVTLDSAYNIFKDAYSNVSGISRTVRGPSMSANSGKVKVEGVLNLEAGKAFILSFIQARDTSWVKKPFLAKYDDKAIWLDDLKPYSGEEKFFFDK